MEADDSYAYVMYPNITPQELLPLANGSRFEVLQNDASVQAVYDKDGKQGDIVLYEDQAYEVDDSFTLTRQGVYTIRTERDHYLVSYYNPVNEEGVEGAIESPRGQEMLKAATEAEKHTLIKVYRPNNEHAVNN